MKDDRIVSGWVPFDEGARMIGRLLGQNPSTRTVAPNSATAQLLDDARAGTIESAGIRYSTGELERISPHDWSECDPHFRMRDHSLCGLREPGRFLPRFVNVYVSPADIQRKYTAPAVADARKSAAGEPERLSGPQPAHPGRPQGTGYRKADESLFDEIDKKMRDDAPSLTAAVRQVIGEHDCIGSGTLESKIKRLVARRRQKSQNNSE